MVERIQCVQCGATLKSAVPVPAGKKIKCTKCGTTFAKAAEGPILASNVGDMFALGQSLYDQPTEEMTSAKASSAAPAEQGPDGNPGSKVRKKRQQQTTGSKKWLLVGVVAGVFLLLGGIGAALFLVSGSSGR